VFALFEVLKLIIREALATSFLFKGASLKVRELLKKIWYTFLLYLGMKKINLFIISAR